MIWEKVQGEGPAVNFLRQSLKKGKAVHAYLFAGPDGVGKGLCARILAQVLNCTRRQSEPCGECASCRAIERGSHPDVFTLVPRGATRGITIDQVREAERLAWLTPQMDGWKVFIFEEAETMNAAAADAFLKTLEEPPSRTMFILLSARPEKLPATVRSRCQTVRFQPWPFDLMAPFLQERAGVEKGEAWVLQCATSGRPGAALRMVEEKFSSTRALILRTLDAAAFAAGKDLMEEVETWLAHLEEKTRRRQAAVEKERSPHLDREGVKETEEKEAAFLAAEKRADYEAIFFLLLSWFRDLYVLKETKAGDLVVNQDRLPVLERQARRFSARELLKMMAWVERSRQAVLLGGTTRFSYQLTLENLFLQLGFWRPPGK